MIQIHQKSTTLTIRSSDVQELIQDLLHVRKTTRQNSDPRIIDEIIFDAEKLYLAAFANTIKKLTYKEMHTEVLRCCEGCSNIKPNQQTHVYCNELDRRTRANDYIDVFFVKLDIFLANKLCFESVGPTTPKSIGVRC